MKVFFYYNVSFYFIQVLKDIVLDWFDVEVIVLDDWVIFVKEILYMDIVWYVLELFIVDFMDQGLNLKFI